MENGKTYRNVEMPHLPLHHVTYGNLPKGAGWERVGVRLLLSEDMDLLPEQAMARSPRALERALAEAAKAGDGRDVAWAGNAQTALYVVQYLVIRGDLDHRHVMAVVHTEGVTRPEGLRFARNGRLLDRPEHGLEPDHRDLDQRVYEALCQGEGLPVSPWFR